MARQRQLDILQPRNNEANDSSPDETAGDEAKGEVQEETNLEETGDEEDDIIDLQLQKAIEYLQRKLAAETKPDAEPKDNQPTDAQAKDVERNDN
jgi:hypothetical protein